MKTRRRFLLPVLLGLLAVSLALNGVLYVRARGYYRQLNELRLDPLNLAAYPLLTPQPARLPLAVFYGDSRAAEWPAPQVEGVLFDNRGIGGQTSAQVLERIDEHLLPLRPDLVIVQVGINDLKTIGLFPERRSQIVTECQAHLRAIVERSLAAGADVIITTIFPVGALPLERRVVWSGEVESAAAEVNGFIRTLASERVRVLDTVPLLAGEGGRVQSAYSDDLLHLTPAGYEALNTALSSMLRAWQAGW